jgi:hypothetical protein
LVGGAKRGQRFGTCEDAGLAKTSATKSFISPSCENEKGTEAMVQTLAKTMGCYCWTHILSRSHIGSRHAAEGWHTFWVPNWIDDVLKLDKTRSSYRTKKVAIFWSLFLGRFDIF